MNQPLQKQTKKLILYTPHEAQLRFHNSKARYRVAAFGRQSGKSTAALNDLLKRAWENESHIYWYVSPTYAQAQVQYRRLVAMMWSCRELMIKKNQSDLRIKLINMSEIRFVSGENFENLRGATLHGAVIDEVREHHRDLWPMVIRPMLVTTNGWCSFISTPAGFDQFYDLAEQAKANVTGEWEFMSAPSWCNPLIRKEEIEALKSSMTEPQFAQEILAEFRDITAGKAYTFTDKNVRNSSPFTTDGTPISQYLPIVVGMDFNATFMRWTLGQENNGHFYFYDELAVDGTNTQECAPELVRRVKDHKMGVILIGDASGKAKHSSATQSDYAIICNALTAGGVKWTNRTPEANPPVRERVNNVNSHLCSADGSVRLFVHPNCKSLKRDFERVVWKEGLATQLDQTKDPSLTHSTDGVGYVVNVLSPLTVDNSVGRMRIIRR